MSAPVDEALEIERRTLEVERELAETRARIAELVGDREERRGGERFTTEVERDLTFDDPTRAAEALLEGMHREYGLVGALQTSGERIEWKPFEAHPRARRLTAVVECGATPSLRLRGAALASHGARMAYTFALLFSMIAVGPISGALGLGPAGSVMLAVALVAAVVYGGLRWSRRASKRRLSRVADRLARRITLGASAPSIDAPRARVVVDEERPDEADADEDEGALVEAAAEEVRGGRRGLS